MSKRKDDGLEEIILAKDWEGHKADTKVRVDPQRAEWLRKDGFEAEAETVAVDPESKESQAPRKRRKAGAK